MTDLAKLVVRLEAQSAQLLTELEKANRKIDRFASSTSKTLQKWSGGLLGFFSARALINFGKEVINAEGNLVGMAERVGTSVDRLSGLGFAADQSASSLDGLTKGLGALADRAADAAEKGGGSAAAFRKIGVEVRKQDGTLKDSADLLLEVADKFSQFEDGAAKSALATDLFGKSGKELIPLLNRGRDGIEELTKRAERLGIVVSQEAAEAANQFNDNLNTLGAIARGVVGKALQEILPYINDLVDGFLNSEDAAERADKAARILATGLKLLLSAGTIIGEVFDRVGDTIGALAAALVAVAEGEFGRATDILQDNVDQTVENVKQTAGELAKIWEEQAQKVVKVAEDTDKKLAGTTLFGGADLIQEVTVKAKKIEKNAVEQFYDDLDEMTKTSSDRAQDEYNKQKEALETLYRAGRISLDEYNERLAEAFDQFLPQIEVTAKKIKEKSEEVNEFQRDLARETQNIIADGLEGILEQGISKGAKGALRAFGDMLEQMALQAIAANITEKIFGAKTAGTEGDGLFDLAMSFFSGGFGGSRDSGGRGYPGVAYAIGTGAQPERFVPDQPGTFVPADKWEQQGPRAASVTQYISVQGRSDLRTARQMQIEAARRQRTASARLG